MLNYKAYPAYRATKTSNGKWIWNKCMPQMPTLTLHCWILMWWNVAVVWIYWVPYVQQTSPTLCKSTFGLSKFFFFQSASIVNVLFIVSTHGVNTKPDTQGPEGTQQWIEVDPASHNMKRAGMLNIWREQSFAECSYFLFWNLQLINLNAVSLTRKMLVTV